MADNTDMSLEPGNFSIQGTMEGIGNQDLIAALSAPEQATADPNLLKPIIKEAAPPAGPDTPAIPAGKVVTPVADNADEKTKSQAALTNFLSNGEESDDNDDNDEVVKTTTQQTTTAPVAPTGDPATDKFTALATDLFSLGVFVKGEDEEDVVIASPEDLLERFQLEKERGGMQVIDNYISRFGEDYQNMFDAIFNKGVNPKDYLGVYNTIVNFTELDLSQEENQIQVVRKALAEQGWDSEDIDTEVDRVKNYGDLENLAAKHHKILVKKEAQKLSELEAKAEIDLQQKTATKNQFVQNVQTVLNDKLKAKEFDGLPLNAKVASELQDFLLVDKWKTPTGETLTDFDRTILDLKKPENHAMKVKLALLIKVLEKDPTLSTIQKAGVTKTSNVLFSEVARQVTKEKGAAPTASAVVPAKWGNL